MPFKVLIVDDAVFMRNMIREIFDQKEIKGKYQVVGEASNGVEAVEKFKTLQPDLVTMDIVMPLKNGIEATKEILSENPKACVVMCSALGQEPLVMEAIDAGAADFIVKPFHPSEVLKVVQTIMEK